MYRVTQGGLPLTTGTTGRAMRGRDLQELTLKAFKYAVTSCRAMCETDDKVDTSLDWNSRTPLESAYIDPLEIVNESTGAVAARVTPRLYRVRGTRMEA